jgi:arsenite methyltransferase
MSRKAKYGLDAPGVLVGLTAGGTILLLISFVNAALGVGFGAVIGPLIGAAFMFSSAAVYLHTTRRGKFAVWARLLDDLGLAGDERVLDLGCGRGAVLIATAHRLPRGRAVGVDLWRSVDQSGNAIKATANNAEAEGVADRVDLRTGDMTALPFADGEFDAVVSSLAIHNIGKKDGRDKALDEAIRVLRPGGRLMIADIIHARDYSKHLTKLGAGDVAVRPLGWRFWYGGPWMGARLVTATRPPAG